MPRTVKGRINLFRWLCIQSAHDFCRVTFRTLYLLALMQNQDVPVQLVLVMVQRLGPPLVHVSISTSRRFPSMEIASIGRLTITEAL